MREKEKWVLAYDKGGKHCGYMTSNMAEIFMTSIVICTISNILP
jgi:hypothetical protein